LVVISTKEEKVLLGNTGEKTFLLGLRVTLFPRTHCLKKESVWISDRN